MATTPLAKTHEPLKTMPGDDIRQILWRFADRFDLGMLVQSVRAVARGPVARLVAQGARNTHEWTVEKQALLEAFDASGITGVFMDPAQGGRLRNRPHIYVLILRRNNREILRGAPEIARGITVSQPACLGANCASN